MARRDDRKAHGSSFQDGNRGPFAVSVRSSDGVLHEGAGLTHLSLDDVVRLRPEERDRVFNPQRGRARSRHTPSNTAVADQAQASLRDIRLTTRAKAAMVRCGAFFSTNATHRHEVRSRTRRIGALKSLHNRRRTGCRSASHGGSPSLQQPVLHGAGHGDDCRGSIEHAPVVAGL